MCRLPLEPPAWTGTLVYLDGNPWLDAALYRDVSGQASGRSVRPLGCLFWGKVWTLAAWCETRQASRSFRIDRMDQVLVQEAGFRDESGKSLADFLRHVGAPP